MKLEGKTALIVGASRNIGKEITLTFAREGAELVINARESGAELHAVAEQCRSLGAATLAVLADVSDPDQVRQLVRQCLDKFGKIDVLVSTVAVRPFKPTLEISNEEWRWVLATNLNSLFYLCREVMPNMMERRTGSIIAFGSLPDQRIVRPGGCTHVAASKAAITAFVQALAVELGPYGIRCNLLAPGLMDTERRHPEWYSHAPKELLQTVGFDIREVPLGRKGRVEEVARAALFLASDDSSYVTGNMIACDGGWFL
jgi:3-oxoacyl-[acyl-carrier protein] reductase